MSCRSTVKNDLSENKTRIHLFLLADYLKQSQGLKKTKTKTKTKMKTKTNIRKMKMVGDPSGLP